MQQKSYIEGKTQPKRCCIIKKLKPMLEKYKPTFLQRKYVLQVLLLTIYILQKRKVLVVQCQLLSHVQLFVTPWIAEYQASQSMGSSRLEFWMGRHSLLQWIFSTQVSKPSPLRCRQILYHLSQEGSTKKKKKKVKQKLG